MKKGLVGWKRGRRPFQDLRFLNWHINRGRIAHNADERELRRYLRQISWRRAK